MSGHQCIVLLWDELRFPHDTFVFFFIVVFLLFFQCSGSFKTILTVICIIILRITCGNLKSSEKLDLLSSDHCLLSSAGISVNATLWPDLGHRPSWLSKFVGTLMVSNSDNVNLAWFSSTLLFKASVKTLSEYLIFNLLLSLLLSVLLLLLLLSLLFASG